MTTITINADSKQINKTGWAWRKEVARFARFLVVGMGSTIVDFVILSALKHFLGWATLPANLVSYSGGALANYLLNCCWVYPQAGKKQTLAQFLQFGLVNLIGLALNNLLVLALETPLSQLLANPAYAYLPAKIIATGVVLVWNFFANRFWTFKTAVLTPAA